MKGGHLPPPGQRRRGDASAASVWDEDLTAAKLECAFRLLTPVMTAITACNGGNTFRLPHSGIRKEMIADRWEI